MCLMPDLLADPAGRGFGIELIHDVGAPANAAPGEPPATIFAKM